jgi:hypothetical protein
VTAVLSYPRKTKYQAGFFPKCVGLVIRDRLQTEGVFNIYVWPISGRRTWPMLSKPDAGAFSQIDSRGPDRWRTTICRQTAEPTAKSQSVEPHLVGTEGNYEARRPSGHDAEQDGSSVACHVLCEHDWPDVYFRREEVGRRPQNSPLPARVVGINRC